MRSNRLFAIVAIAIASVASAVTTAATDIYTHAVAAVHRAWDYMSACFRALPSSPPKAQADLNPISLLVAAKSFMQRMSKRERPRVTPLWRMCPSI